MSIVATRSDIAAAAVETIREAVTRPMPNDRQRVALSILADAIADLRAAGLVTR